MTKVSVSMKDRVTIAKALEDVLIEDGEYWAFKDDWSDAKIADKIGFPTNAVANTRVGVFGRLRPHNPSHSLFAAIRRIDELERLFRNLAIELAELKERLGDTPNRDRRNGPSPTPHRDIGRQKHT